MPKSSIGRSQKENLVALEAFGEDQQQGNYFSTIEDSLAYLGLVYTKKLTDRLTKVGSISSGALEDSIRASEVRTNGSVLTVDIYANEYASYLDEGVNGWALSRGSNFQFKTKGVNPNGAMVASIKEYLAREKKIGTIKNRPVNNRERKRQSIRDATTQQAISVAYMIKRQGIKPTHFWRDATAEMTALVAAEFAVALKIDIINALTGQKY